MVDLVPFDDQPIVDEVGVCVFKLVKHFRVGQRESRRRRNPCYPVVKQRRENWYAANVVWHVSQVKIILRRDRSAERRNAGRSDKQ